MTATATAEPLTASDLEDIIAATEKTLVDLTAEQRRLSLAVIRKAPGATEALTAVEAMLVATREAHKVASDAIIALGVEEAAAAEIAVAAESAKTEAAYAQARATLDETLLDFQNLLDDLTVGVKVALAAGNEVFNLGVARSIHGNPLGTRNYIESRIGHVLNLEAGLTQFDLARGTGREPLVGATPAQDRVVPQATPLPERRDEHDMQGAYPGQQPNSRPITKTELKNAAGEWVEVPIGSVDWPTEPVGEMVLDDDLEALRADAAKRSAKRRSTRSK